MSSTFVRVSVLHEDKQLDVSLPVQRPVVDYIDDVIGLLAEVPTDNEPNKNLSNTHVWVLSTPISGIVEPYATLAERGITDGQRLYLTRRHEAAHTPFVDDAIAEVRSTIADAQWRWFEKMRSGALIGSSLLLLELLSIMAGLPLLNNPSASPIGIPTAIIGVVAIIAVAVALWQPQSWMRWLALLFPLNGGIVASSFLSSRPLWWLCVVMVSAIPAAFVAGRKQPVGAVAGTTALFIVSIVLAATAFGVDMGLNLIAIAAWSAWVPMAMLLVAPTVALKATGLATMLRRNDVGDQVARDAIQHKALRSEAISRGVVWSATALTFGILVILTGSGYWHHGVISGLISLVILLRVNGFADTRIIAALLVTGTSGLVLTAGAVVGWMQSGWVSQHGLHLWWLPQSESSWAVWCTAALVCLLCVATMIIAQFRAPDDLEEARLSKVLSVIDVIASLAIIPVILAAQGAFVYYWANS